MPSLFTELRRRNVFKVGAAYAIVAWLLLQITDIVLPTFNAPQWVAQTITFLLIIGFPITLLMAWAYEMTPEGIKAAADVKPSDSITPATGQRLNYVILGLVVLAVAFVIVDQYVLDQGMRASVVGTSRPRVITPTRAGSTPTSASTGLQRWAINVGITNGLGGSGLNAEVAVSPDGSRLVYAANVGGGSRLYMRLLDQFDAQPIPGAENGRQPFFSPGGEWVGFHDGSGPGNVVGFRKVAVRGGPPQTLTPLTQRAFGASWGTDDTIVFSSTEDGGVNSGSLVRISAAGGAPETLLTPEPGIAHTWPHILPGGNAILFTLREVSGPASEGSIAVLALETGEYRTLIAGGYNARYAPTGHIVFARAGTLWAVPFDLERLETTGTETPMVEGVQMNSTLGFAPFGFSDDGLLVYVRGGDTSNTSAVTRSLMWVDREGREEILAAEPLTYFYPRLSPDGRRLAVTVLDQVGGAGNQDVTIYDLTRTTLSRLTSDPANDQRPVFTPDSQQVVYWSAREEGGIFRRAANGTGQAERLTTSSATQNPEFFSSDGTQLVFRDGGRGNNWDLRLLSMEGEPVSQSLLRTDFNEYSSAISPDGRWIAYVSNETGRNEVYVRPFPNIDDDKRQISRNGGDEPLWGPDGKELFYLSQTDAGAVEILMVSVTTEPTFSAGAPELLFTGAYFVGNRPIWDISFDGQRFLMMRAVGQTGVSEQTSIAFVDNWFEELNRLAPRSP